MKSPAPTFSPDRVKLARSGTNAAATVSEHLGTTMRFLFLDHTHTLGSMLREALEESNPEDFVSCTVTHPLNTFLEVHAPSEAAVRAALQRLQSKLTTARVGLLTDPTPAAPSNASAAVEDGGSGGGRRRSRRTAAAASR